MHAFGGILEWTGMTIHDPKTTETNTDDCPRAPGTQATGLSLGHRPPKQQLVRTMDNTTDLLHSPTPLCQTPVEFRTMFPATSTTRVIP